MSPSSTHFAFVNPHALLWLAILLLITVSGIAIFLKLQVRPLNTFQIGVTRVEVYCIPLWSLQKIKGDAYIAFCDETGFIGEGKAKPIRDKADYRLDDRIEESAPYPPTIARAFPVTRLPCRHLIITNIYNEKGVVTRDSFRTAFTNAIKQGESLNASTYVILDPTDDWNYYEHRANPDFAAQLLYDAIQANQNAIRCIKILTEQEEYAEAYHEQAVRMQHKIMAA